MTHQGFLFCSSDVKKRCRCDDLAVSPPHVEKRVEMESKGEDGTTDADVESLKYHLLGPSLTKAGQDEVNQQRVCRVAM